MLLHLIADCADIINDSFMLKTSTNCTFFHTLCCVSNNNYILGIGIDSKLFESNGVVIVHYVD